MKKLFYALCIAAVLVIIGMLTYQRIVRRGMQVISQNAQTIIPIAPQSNQRNGSSSEPISENMQSAITLLSDEVLVDEVQADVNGDNKEDKIIAAKKLSDQFIYLFIFLQENEAQTFTRASEIKTEATHAKTLSIYTLTVQEYQYPIIVYSGMNADNMQVLGMYTAEIDKDTVIRMHSLAGIQADGQIILKNNRDNSISGYMIAAYYSDRDAPNTLNQIEKQYTWNEKKKLFEQTREIKIPGKKLKVNFLRNFKQEIVILFKRFLKGFGINQVQKEIKIEVFFLIVPKMKLFFPSIISKNFLLLIQLHRADSVFIFLQKMLPFQVFTGVLILN